MVASEVEEADDKQPTLDIIYQEICNNYRAIDDLRMKLMGALPLASGIGILLLSRGSGIHKWFNEPAGFLLLPIGLFGHFIAFGLFLFEHRGMQRCIALIEAGKKIEFEAGSKGSFLSTPDSVGIFNLRPLETEPDHSFSIAANARGIARVIYPTVLAAWVFVFFAKICSFVLKGAVVGAIAAGVIALVFLVLFFWWSTRLLKTFDEQLKADDE